MLTTSEFGLALAESIALTAPLRLQHWNQCVRVVCYACARDNTIPSPPPGVSVVDDSHFQPGPPLPERHRLTWFLILLLLLAAGLSLA
ncbi:hypothetical protein LX15_000010 [Streptoalloteichus tenebrarius]|uniref:Uncharacterized protein n=2 Tax=Streptoalloteichus tenebrarius (strain ATCC 17920 / DSM 40477 / JCM 4838 / CBS 697.72 / NBRC 16177 / NCIMB 11028 / NRRL B-12390 / A12253. 1 / ISP 5477) TaxID=1933 RepID=A0ABT1HLD9_STRSD|nr:hypothetical protein [Streptoalloteichus tenebrarius]MCP2256327.1 hypothetical protein [Streptoalloteichus tenebrarius]BFF04666.1 hypothetical protein GCM10020241_63410 [Streptoalloteichus tenebrarius]